MFTHALLNRCKSFRIFAQCESLSLSDGNQMITLIVIDWLHKFYYSFPLWIILSFHDYRKLQGEAGTTLIVSIVNVRHFLWNDWFSRMHDHLIKFLAYFVFSIVLSIERLSHKSSESISKKMWKHELHSTVIIIETSKAPKWVMKSSRDLERI